MNAFAWVLATLAVLRLAIYAFQTLQDDTIGLALIGMTFVCLGMSVGEAFQDIAAWRSKANDED